MSILKNAVDSIQIGMEDYHSDDPRRVLSAIRNVYAGLLLIFKHKLQALSPTGSNDSLLKARLELALDPSGAPIWKGKGNLSVDAADIEARLKALGISGIDWKRLQKLREIRNDVEHYFSKHPVNLMKEVVASSLQLLTEFCEPHLGQRPADLFGDECWDMMLAVASFHEGEVAACQKKLAAIQWPYKVVASSIDKMRCGHCDSQLIQLKDETAGPHAFFECLACQALTDYEVVIGMAIVESLLGENYNRRKAGQPPASDECPGCGEQAYVYAEQICVACHYEPGQYTHCEVCGTLLEGEDAFSPICSYHRHKMHSAD
ncbi:hypothetical protein HNE05_17060 [Aquipseudomonas campi]|uniref:Uncharacterized protein n=1 Tax=Aquipseudomonas campi TaxID=2731681 RepID=A0A6M8FM69_9GAMM|nr:hypothetical protein [Pseudomonas campi]QKE64989.1 hypothetical protein HNE05_17060 [Pseudomonas campi]